jgi:hypothetical protein
MRHQPHYVKSFSGLGWGQSPSVRLTGGPTYERIVIDTNDGTNFLAAADILFARIYLNGDMIHEWTGADLVMLVDYAGLPAQNGIFVLPFEDVTAQTIAGQEQSAFVTFPTDAVDLKITLAAAGGRAWNPTLKAVGYVSAAQSKRTLLKRTRTINFDASAVGLNNLTTVERGPAIMRMHFATSATDLSIQRDFVTVYENTAEINAYNLKQLGRVPQTGYFHFDPVATGFNQADIFRTVSNQLDFRLTTTAAGNIPVLIESLEARNDSAPVVAVA